MDFRISVKKKGSGLNSVIFKVVNKFFPDLFLCKNLKELNGLVVKVDLNDKDARIIMEVKDINFITLPAALFELPEG